MKRTGLAEPIRLSAIEFFFWSSIACFEGFMVPYLTSVGYRPAQIGPIMGAVFGPAIVGQPVLGAISDRISSPKWLIAVAMVVAGSVVVLIPAAVGWYAAVLVIVLVYSVSGNSLPAVLDGWIMARRDYNPRINYGIARGFGSAGFATAALALGYVAERWGPGIVFPVYLGIAIATAALAVTAPQMRPTASTEETTPPCRDGAPKTRSDRGLRSLSRRVWTRVGVVGRNRRYVLFLIASFLAFVGFRAAFTFLPLLIDELGGTLSHVGLAHSIGAISEVPFLFLSALILRRLRGSRFVALTLLLFGLRLSTYSVLTSTAQVLGLQLTHGLTFGLFIAASVDYIHAIAPPEHRTLFQAIAPSVYFGLGSIVGSWIGGIVVEAISVFWAFRGAGVLAVAGSLVLFVSPAHGSADETDLKKTIT
ncbi:MAG: MFS transporter [Spirochaetales bacterium]